MTRRACRLLGPVAIAAFLSIGMPQARAQLAPSAGGGIGGNHSPTKANGADDENKAAPPPPSIPGAVVAPDSVVPASKTAKDLDPNSALFDAIDRGDLTAARDALNRGADLNARNVLGQRPLDMSIDLSRNAITFLLLSMRSQAGDPDEAVAQGGGEAQAPTAPPAVETHRRRRGRPEPQTPTLVATEQPRATSAVEAQPSAGFLGFGSH